MSAQASEQTPLFSATGPKTALQPPPPCSSDANVTVPGLEDIENKSTDSPYRAGFSVARFWLIFGGILLQYFVACFDSTLMASSHPVITSYFEASNSASWLSTAFLLTSTACQPLIARISDTIGRRPIYIFAQLVFALTTVWCALAQSIGSFIAARALCGLGAGGVLAMGAILTNDLVPIEIRGNYQAYINLFWGLGQAGGAAFGGILCDTLGWRWTFGIQIPAQLLILVAAVLVLPDTLGPCLAKNSDKSAWQHIMAFDLLGSLLLTVTVAFMVLALNLGVFAGFALVRVEARAALPVVPLSMLSTAPRGNLVFSNLFGSMGGNAVVFNAPLYFQAVKLDSASRSGFRMMGPSLAIMVCGVSSGLIMTYTRRMKELILGGSLIALAGAICLTSMWDGIPTWMATVFVVPVNIGVGFSYPATSLAVLATSAHEDQAVMTGTLSLSRSLGAVFGVAISSLIVQNVLSVNLERYITGPDKRDIILRIRKSVRAIFELEKKHQTEVIRSYEHSLRYVFVFVTVLFAAVCVLVMPITLPRLGHRKR